MVVVFLIPRRVTHFCDKRYEIQKMYGTGFIDQKTCMCGSAVSEHAKVFSLINKKKRQIKSIMVEPGLAGAVHHR